MPRNMGAVWSYADEPTRADDAREIHSPRTIEGEPVCCGGVTKCVDSHATDCGTVEQRWYCMTCERTTTTEEILRHDDPTPEPREDDGDEDGEWMVDRWWEVDHAA